MMQLLMAHGARHPDGSLAQFDPANPATNPNMGGINYCDQSSGPGDTREYTKGTVTTPSTTGPRAWAWATRTSWTTRRSSSRTRTCADDLPGSQTVRTFVVGYGDSSPMLQSIAIAGRGRFYRADSPTALREALLFSMGEARAPACSSP